MNKKKEIFCCPSCGEKNPFSRVWALSNNSVYQCGKCRAELIPEKMSPFYFVIAFIGIAGTGHLLMKKTDSFLIIITGSALVGVVIYLIGILFAYKTVRFKVN